MGLYSCNCGVSLRMKICGQNYQQLLTIIIKDDEEYYPQTVSELVTYFDRPLSTLSNLLVIANPKVTPPSQHLYQLTE